MKPGFLGDEKLCRCATDREPKVVVANHTVANHVVAGLETGYLGANSHDLSGPLVARDDRVAKRDDVAAFEELDVGVANTDGARSNQYFVFCDVWNRKLVYLGNAFGNKFKCLHFQKPLTRTLVSLPVGETSSSKPLVTMSSMAI